MTQGGKKRQGISKVVSPSHEQKIKTSKTKDGYKGVHIVQFYSYEQVKKF